MHELSLARAIVDLVEEHAARDAFAHTRKIRIALGALSHVDPGALSFGFETVARGTVAQGAELAFERPSGRGFCTDCGRQIDVAALGAACPRCGGHRWLVVGGDEMKVLDLEVD